jgi:glycosyltransferase involved in cell wall biosynthesis
MPQHGIFVENRLRHLVAGGEVASLVVAPVPWFPFQHKAFGRYASFARVPREEQRHGLTVLHPRYPLLPKAGMSSAPVLMYAALRKPCAEILKARFSFDLIDAHYFYPDGVAAALLGRSLGKPVVITARGTDVNLIPAYRVPRRLVRWAAARAAGVAAVSEALRERLIELGVPAGRVQVLRNGVDLALFAPRDRAVARRELGLDAAGPIVLSVGSLLPVKAVDLVIRAVAALPKAILVVVGDGPDKPKLQRLAQDLSLGERVRFLVSMAQPRLATAYNAADVLVLASAREGCPNVVLEALACATPVVAAAVGGVPEIVREPAAGRLIEDRTPAAIAGALSAVLADPPPRAMVRAYAEHFAWGPTTAGQIRLFRSILDRPG